MATSPHVKLYQGTTMTELSPTAYEAVTHALMSGAEWFEGETLNGAPFLVRCASVTDVHLVTQRALDAAAADNQPEWAT